MRGALHLLLLVCLDSDVACWVICGAVLGLTACWHGGFFHLVWGVSVWCADGPWLGGFALCLSVGAGGCHVNKVT